MLTSLKQILDTLRLQVKGESEFIQWQHLWYKSLVICIVTLILGLLFLSLVELVLKMKHNLFIDQESSVNFLCITLTNCN